MPELVYLDSSAIVKLILRERESAALLKHLTVWPQRISSALARVEVLRAVSRSRSKSADRRRAEAVLERLALIKIDDNVLASAAHLEPPELRALDAIHLATALSVRSDLAGLVVYDSRLSMAAIRMGFTVWAPH